jgi:hypothetical protein
MLCDNEINNFRDLIEPSNDLKRAADYISNNGNLKTCKNEYIKTYSRVLSYDQCEISWGDTEETGSEDIGYILQYVSLDDFDKEEFDENTLYERNTCSAYVWINVVLKQEQIVTKKSNGVELKVFVLKNLEQYTTYAFTIQPYNYNMSNINQNYSLSGASEVNKFR